VTAPTRPPRERCAVHPSRPAVDTCPVCARPRCGADAAAMTGCLGCQTPGEPPARVAPPPSDRERLVRAALAGYAVALLGGVIGSEYVGATVFEYLGPFVVGVVCGGAAARAAGTDGTGRVGRQVRIVGALLALLSVALGFVLEKSHHVLSLSADVLLPYAAAVAGALLWTMPPRRGQGLATDV
jgi:hypothetical protein